MAKSKSISIWFFVGVLTLAYGLVLFVTGLWEFPHPLDPNVVHLSQYHSTFWWGMLMTAFGAFYTLRFRPGKA